MSVDLTLYIVGNRGISRRAQLNFQQLLQQCGPEVVGRVIDLYEDPELASKHSILAAPLLVRSSPEPVLKIVGDLANVEQILQELGLSPASNQETHP